MTKLLIVLMLSTAVATAQETAPTDFQLPEPTRLTRGTPAPFTGTLMLQEDFLRWARAIEDLRHQLAGDVQLERDRCDVRVTTEQARTTAATDRADFHDRMWGERNTALVADVAAANEATRRAAQRDFWESPPFWFAIGVLVSVALGAGAAGLVAALGG
jgi:hypothetical protein